MNATADRNGLKMENLNHVIDRHVSALDGIALRLDHLSGALGVIGMDRLSDDLAAIADHLPILCRELRSAYHNDLTGHVQNAQENTALLLKATLAGVFKAPSSAA